MSKNTPSSNLLKVSLKHKIANVIINLMYAVLIIGYAITNSKWFLISLITYLIIASEITWWYNRNIAMPILKQLVEKLK